MGSSCEMRREVTQVTKIDATTLYVYLIQLLIKSKLVQ